MSEVRLVSVNVGQPREFGPAPAGWPPDPPDRPRRSGIFKAAVAGPVWLGATNLDGDAQADRVKHGGPDKAVNAYAADHYAAWRAELGLPGFPHGAFGENFTIADLTEDAVCVGDTYAIGEARVQVSQPRVPCWKLARRWGLKELTALVERSGRTGWYFRVLAEGMVTAGLPVILLDRPFPQWTIARVNAIGLRRDDDLTAADLAACPLLADVWREGLRRRVAGAR